MKTLSVALILMFCVFLQVVPAEENRFATIEWPPYVGEILEEQGFVAEIVETAWKKSGADLTLEFLPIKRAITSTQKGLYVGMFPYLQEGGECDPSLLLSEPFAGTALVFYQRKSDPLIQYTTLEDLTPYHIGVVLGFSYTSEFDAATYLKKETTNEDKTNFLKLVKGRLDLAIADKYVADNLFKTELADIAPSITQIDPPFSVRPIYVAFSKQSPNAEAMLQNFNTGLREIKRDGTLEQIVKKYGYFTISSQSFTPEDVEELVKQATQFIDQAGLEAAFQEFKRPDGRFTKGELYIFAVAMDGLTLAHINPDLVGVNNFELQDKFGFLFIQEFIDVAKTRGSGWVEYWWENPITKKIQPKITYIQRVNDDLFIGCGIYK